MNAKENARSAAILRSGNYGKNNATDWTPIPPDTATKAEAKIISLFGELNTPETGIIDKLSAYGVGVISGEGDYHSGTTLKVVLRNAVNSDLKAINDGAAAIAEAQEKPELMDGFRLPHGVSDEQLGKKALSFAEKAAAIEEELIELGLDEDFIQQLKDRAKKFGEAADDQEVGLEGQVGSGKGLGVLLKKGLVVHKQLNVAMKNLYKDDATKLGAWMTAQHIERTSSKKKKPALAAAPTT